MGNNGVQEENTGIRKDTLSEEGKGCIPRNADRVKDLNRGRWRLHQGIWKMISDHCMLDEAIGDNQAEGRRVQATRNYKKGGSTKEEQEEGKKKEGRQDGESKMSKYEDTIEVKHRRTDKRKVEELGDGKKDQKQRRQDRRSAQH